MRYGLLALGILVCVGVSQDWFARAVDRATSAALSEDARLAIDVRCQLPDERAARECRSTLKRLYLSGALDPDRSLRTWCDAVESAWWGGRGPALPEVCVERYGGWPRGLNRPADSPSVATGPGGAPR